MARRWRCAKRQAVQSVWSGCANKFISQVQQILVTITVNMEMAGLVVGLLLDATLAEGSAAIFATFHTLPDSSDAASAGPPTYNSLLQDNRSG